jgi:hypothetical protein
MLTFDICDVIMEIAKIFHRASYHTTATTFFAGFVVSWYDFSSNFLHKKNDTIELQGCIQNLFYVLPSAFRAQIVAQVTFTH